MGLADDLAARRKESRGRIPADKLEIMDRTARLLEQSGLTETCLREGDTAPDFVLPNAFGKKVALRDLLKRGPVVLSFYRGGW